MHALFVILNYISVFVMIACVVIVSTHESSRMQKLAMMVCTMLLVCCIGFLIKSEAQTADALIVGQKLVYATVTHGMFLMLLFLLEYCKFSIPKVLRWCFHGINLLLTAAVLTLDHHPLFYVSYWAENAGDHFNLEKTTVRSTRLLWRCSCFTWRWRFGLRSSFRSKTSAKEAVMSGTY